MTRNLAKNIGKGGIAAILRSKAIIINVIVYLVKLGLIKGFTRPLKVSSTNNIVRKYSTKKKEKVKILPDINPRSKKELLAIEETTIR